MKSLPQSDEVMEGLTTMVRAVREDSHLSRWFEALEGLATSQRQIELLRMCQSLSSRDADVAKSLTLLCDDRVFAAAVLAYRST